MKLLREMSEAVDYTKSSGKYRLEGIFIQADVVNRNGRTYPSDIMAEQVEKYNENFIQKRRAFGELGHPNNPSINLHLVSHLITNLQQEGTNWIGVAEILDTPNGQIIKNFMDAGCTLGISSRGLGSIKEVKGIKEVQQDFVLVTAGDVVADPSAPDAFLNNIVEGIEWLMAPDGTWVAQNMEAIKAEADVISREYKALKEEKEAAFLEVFQNFLKKIKI